MAPRIVVMLVMVLCVGLGAAAQGDTQRSETQDVMSSLLNEVRALRITLETVAAAGANGQLTLGRLQLQEQRLTAAIARLEGTREQLASARRAAANNQEEIARLEERMRDASHIVTMQNPEMERENLKRSLKFHQKWIVENTAEIQRLTAEEATLTSEVATDQGRWFELNRRLEEIEHNLARRIGPAGVR